MFSSIIAGLPLAIGLFELSEELIVRGLGILALIIVGAVGGNTIEAAKEGRIGGLLIAAVAAVVGLLFVLMPDLVFDIVRDTFGDLEGGGGG